jgi:hypothetical protein
LNRLLHLHKAYKLQFEPVLPSDFDYLSLSRFSNRSKNYLATCKCQTPSYTITCNKTSYWLSDSLDLIQSPRKLLEAKSLERTAACLTTVYMINTLLTPRSDSVELKWYIWYIFFIALSC